MTGAPDERAADSDPTLPETTVGEFVRRLAARRPVPGGGAVAALMLAQSAALVAMVARYTSGDRWADRADLVEPVLESADRILERALELIQEDAAAFAAVGAALGLPKCSDQEQGRRRAALASALTKAAGPPAEVVELAARVMELAERLLPAANSSLTSDLAVAAASARAAAAAGRVNVEVNVPGIPPEARGRLDARISAVDVLCARAIRLETAVRERLGAKAEA